MTKNIALLRTLVNNGWNIANRRKVVSQIGESNFGEVTRLAQQAGVDTFEYQAVKELLTPAQISETKSALGHMTEYLKTAKSKAVLPVPSRQNTDSFKLTSTIQELTEITGAKTGNLKTTSGRLVGQYKFRMIEAHPIETPLEKRILPESWIDSATGMVKKHLYIDYFDTSAIGHEKGFGREAIKRFYLESVKRGGGGNIALDWAWKSLPFYKKMGFKSFEREALMEYKRLILRLENKIKRLKTCAGNNPNASRELEDTKKVLENIYKDLQEYAKTGVDARSHTHKLYFTATPETVVSLFSK